MKMQANSIMNAWMRHYSELGNHLNISLLNSFHICFSCSICRFFRQKRKKSNSSTPSEHGSDMFLRLSHRSFCPARLWDFCSFRSKYLFHQDSYRNLWRNTYNVRPFKRSINNVYFYNNSHSVYSRVFFPVTTNLMMYRVTYTNRLRSLNDFFLN